MVTIAALFGSCDFHLKVRCEQPGRRRSSEARQDRQAALVADDELDGAADGNVAIDAYAGVYLGQDGYAAHLGGQRIRQLDEHVARQA